ncbi:competence protein ComA [Haemophilus haemoglobinophilus]|nr:competence protein ComA [Canicola haemoglobinophilus]
MGLRRKVKTTLQIGTYRQGEKWQFLWFDEQKQPHFTIKNTNIPFNQSDLPQQSSKSVMHKWITCLPNQYVWSKTIALTQKLNEQECQQQCHLIIENELPTESDDIWYDYQYSESAQGSKLSIYVVKQQMAKDYVTQFSPLKITILDCLTNSLLRAFRYFHNKQEKMETLYLYQDSNGSIAIQENGQQTLILQKTDKNLTALYQQFCHRFNCQPQQVYCYCEDNHTQYTNDEWNIIKTELPFIALGNALWGKSDNQGAEVKEQ